MAVKITLIDNSGETPVFAANDLVSGEEITVKNWFEKSKDKWHVVLGTPNSANRKYVAHNAIMAGLDANNEYVVEDRTTPNRTLGTSQPDKKLVPYMSDEDKAEYEAIIARAIENKKAQMPAKAPKAKQPTKAELVEEAKAKEAEINALKEQLLAAGINPDEL